MRVDRKRKLPVTVLLRAIGIDTDEKIQKRVEFDLYYIENWSVLFDLYILLKTPLALMTKSENAY